MFRTGWGSAAGLLLAIAVAAAQGSAGTPGAVNHTEGEVSLEGKLIPPGSLEGVAVGAGQTLSTAKGNAEVILTPGVFLRLGDQTAVKITDTRVDLVRGEAILEVVQPVTGHLEIHDGDTRTVPQRAGIYVFHAGKPVVAVTGGNARSRKGLESDALYVWSEARARAGAQASIDTAQALVGTNPNTWKGPGWYWNPFYGEWGFLPATYTLTGPFGETYFSARFYYTYAGVESHSHGYFDAAQ